MKEREFVDKNELIYRLEKMEFDQAMLGSKKKAKMVRKIINFIKEDIEAYTIRDFTCNVRWGDKQ